MTAVGSTPIRPAIAPRRRRWSERRLVLAACLMLLVAGLIGLVAWNRAQVETLRNATLEGEAVFNIAKGRTVDLTTAGGLVYIKGTVAVSSPANGRESRFTVGAGELIVAVGGRLHRFESGDHVVLTREPWSLTVTTDSTGFPSLGSDARPATDALKRKQRDDSMVAALPHLPALRVSRGDENSPARSLIVDGVSTVTIPLGQYLDVVTGAGIVRAMDGTFAIEGWANRTEARFSIESGEMLVKVGTSRRFVQGEYVFLKRDPPSVTVTMDPTGFPKILDHDKHGEPVSGLPIVSGGTRR